MLHHAAMVAIPIGLARAFGDLLCTLVAPLCKSACESREEAQQDEHHQLEPGLRAGRAISEVCICAHDWQHGREDTCVVLVVH